MTQVSRISEGFLALRDRHPSSRKIFVVGTGRSGTHFLAQSLGAHSEIHPSIEDRFVFRRLIRMALDPSTRSGLLPAVIRRVKLRHALCAPRHYLDKSHPAIWTAGDIAYALPQARFVGIERDVYGTVASMLKHRGVLRWQRTWRQYPVPNLFLGITPEIAAIYDELDLVEQCALRWKAHAERMRELEGLLGNRFLQVRFEELVKNTESVLSTLQEFLGLSAPIPQPEVNATSLEKWRDELDHESQRAIARWIGQDSP